MEFRPYYFAKEWKNKGHDVTILASSFSHSRVIQPKIKKLINYEEIDGINYIWIYGNNYKKNGILRVINILIFNIISLYLPFLLKKNFDVIINSSTYTIDIFPALFINLMQKLLRKQRKSILVYEPHDLWPMVLTEIGKLKKFNPFVMLNSLGERMSCKYSDVIISMHPGNINHLVKKGADKINFYHIPNGVNVEDWERPTSLTKELNSRFLNIKKKKKKIILYAGTVSIANDIKLLIEASEKSKLSAEYVIIGDGTEVDFLKKYTKGKKNTFHFFGKIEKKYIPKSIEFADICYVGFKYNKLYEYGVSANKIWDYMMSSKAIIMSINSCNDPVKDANCGITVNTGSVKDLASAIDEMLIKDNLEELGINGRDYVMSNNQYPLLAEKCITIFNKYLKDK